jgi:hypothetical protein
LAAISEAPVGRFVERAIPKGGHRVEVVTPAAIGPHDDDLDLVFQEVDRMQE